MRASRPALPTQGPSFFLLAVPLPFATDTRQATASWAPTLCSCVLQQAESPHPPTINVSPPVPNPAGDCKFKMEVLRGNLGVRQQHQKCVRRRAELSVSMNPYCGGVKGARAAVDAVFEPCFADTAPFDRIP